MLKWLCTVCVLDIDHLITIIVVHHQNELIISCISSRWFCPFCVVTVIVFISGELWYCCCDIIHSSRFCICCSNAMSLVSMWFNGGCPWPYGVWYCTKEPMWLFMWPWNCVGGNIPGIGPYGGGWETGNEGGDSAIPSLSILFLSLVLESGKSKKYIILLTHILLQHRLFALYLQIHF